MMFSKDSYDVVVIGAGPGGCSAASICARGGASVLHVERSSEPAFKVGESLMPETYWTFEKMGALDLIRNAGFVEKYSVQFYAKSGKASAPFYFDSLNDHESSQTWQVHRADFDELLFENGRRQGAECHRGVNVREVLFEGDRASGIRATTSDGQELEVRSKAIIDASGQGSLLARRFKLERESYGFDHASIFTHFEGAFRDPGRDEGATLILQTDDGSSWFWYIPLARDAVSVGVVGSVDALIRSRSGLPHETFFDEVKRCPEIERRIAGARQCRPVSVIKDFSYSGHRVAGDGWVLVGDAFGFIDPVYSSGVFLALKSGEMAAEAVLDGLECGDLGAGRLGAFQSELKRGMQSVLGLVRSFYAKDFSFGGFLREYPHHQKDVTRILIGDVFQNDFAQLFADMESYKQKLLSREPMASDGAMSAATAN